MASLVVSMGSRHTGSVVVALGLVGSSWTRARTSVACAGRRILIHCTNREAQQLEIAHVQQRRPTTTKINKSLKKWPYICASGGKKYNIQFGKNVQK